MNKDETLARDWDPESHNLPKTEQCNKVKSVFLMSLGCESFQLQVDAPSQSKKKSNIMEPQTKEGVEAIQTPKLSGQITFCNRQGQCNLEDLFLLHQPKQNWD